MDTEEKKKKRGLGNEREEERIRERKNNTKNIFVEIKKNRQQYDQFITCNYFHLRDLQPLKPQNSYI